MASAKIEEVPESELTAFIQVPYLIHRDDPFWVPPLKKDQLHLLSLRHPFWEHASRKLFIAKPGDDNVPCGCAAAIIDNNHNSFHNEKCGFFGFFESIDDPQVSKALLERCQSWLKSEGMNVMRGPVNPSTNETCGLLIEGFDSSPVIMMPYNPHYYAGLLEDFGLSKAKDLYAFKRYSNDPIPEKFQKILSRVDRNTRVRIRFARISSFRKELSVIKEIYNDAWEKNWGFIPMTDDEIDDMAKALKPILKSDHLFFAEVGGVPAAFALVIPDVNMALKHVKGRLTPFNLPGFLWRLRKIPSGRLIAMGVKKEFRNRGIELLMIRQAIFSARKLGWTYAELSWILEDNKKIIRTIELVGGKLYKKYRIYEKPMGPVHH